MDREGGGYKIKKIILDPIHKNNRLGMFLQDFFAKSGSPRGRRTGISSRCKYKGFPGLELK